MVKKKQKILVTSKRGYLFITVGVILLSVLSGGFGYELHTWQADIVNAPVATRKARIVAIYDSLKLGPEYQLQTSDIFGDKRPYSYDASRTFSSSQTYVRGADVKTTVAALRTSIEAAGFTFFEEPYPGSSFTELHFKSAKNEYIRLNVSSKPRDDALRDSALMNTSLANVVDMDSNAGPSNITIKVNLDDNNE